MRDSQDFLRLLKTKPIQQALAPLADQMTEGAIQAPRQPIRQFEISQNLAERIWPPHDCSFGLIRPHQVSRLVLLSEEVKNLKCNISEDVCTSARNVYVASQALISACRKQVENGEMAKDLEFLRQCVPACEDLDSVAENFVNVCQELLNVVHEKAIWRRLVISGRSILDSTMKILSMIDMADVAALVRAVRFLQDRLRVVAQVHTMTALIPAFKSYSERLQSMVVQVEKRLRDISDHKQRDDILICISLLKRSSSPLAAAMKISVKYAGNKHALASKQFICGELDNFMEDLVCYLESRTAPSDVDRDDDGGQFMEHVCEILVGLSPEHRLTADRFELDTRIENVIRHSMAVAHLSASEYRQNIVTCCKKILRTRNDASNCLKDLRKYPDIGKLKPHFDALNETLISEFRYLEEHVNKALVQQIVEVFSVTTEPLEFMVQMALYSEDDKEELLKAAMDVFSEHAEKVTQVAQFSAANNYHSKRNREIRLCCGQLDRLEAQLLPAIVGFRQNTKDAAATQRLKLLKAMYSQYFNSLLDALDQTMNTDLFVQISGQRILSQAENVHQAVLLKDCDDIQLATKTLIGQARRVVDVTSRAAVDHTVTYHRNSVLSNGVELRKVISMMRSNTARLVQEVTSEKYQNRLQNDARKLVDLIQRLMAENADMAQSIVRSAPILEITDEEGRTTSASPDDVETEKRSVSNFGLVSPLAKMDESIRTLTIESSKLRNKTKDQSVGPRRNDVNLTLSCIAQSLVDRLIQKCLILDTSGTDKVCDEVGNMVENLTEMLKNLSVASVDKQTERCLMNSVDLLTNITPTIADISKRIASASGDEVDRLHTKTRQWMRQIKNIEEQLSSILGELEVVARAVVESVGNGQESVIIKQCRLLENWYQRLNVVVTSLCTETETVISNHQLTSIKDILAEVETMTRTVVAMATTSDDGDLKKTLNLMARQWCVKFVCCLWHIDQITVEATKPILPILDESMIGKQEDEEQIPKSHRERVLNRIQKFSIKSTNMLKALISSSPDAGAAVEECEELVGAMNKIVTSLTTRQTMENDVVSRRYFDVMMVHWLVTVETFCSGLEDCVTDSCLPINRLIQLALAVHTSSGDHLLSDELENLSNYLDGIVAKLMEDCDVTDDVKGTKVSCVPGLFTEVNTVMSKNHPTVIELRGKARRISQITKQILKLIKKIARRGYICGLEICILRLEWACLLGAIVVVAKDVNQCLAYDIENEVSRLRESVQSKCLQCALDPAKDVRTEISLSSVRPSDVDRRSRRAAVEKDLSASYHTMPSTPRIKPRLRPRLSPAPCSSYLSASFRSKANQSLLGPAVRRDSDSAALSAACRLDVEVARWLDDENMMVQLARDLSKLTQRLIVRAGTIPIPTDVIEVTRQITGKALRFHHFIRVIADYTVEKKSSGDLLYYADNLPDIATRLSIISSIRVTQRKPADDESEEILHEHCENMMRTILQSLVAAQVATSQGILVSSERKLSQMESLVLSTRWVRRSA